MSSNHTLEDLLSLSLGTPEIGAVNFNYLFELLNEILKHLGIAKKISGNGTEEVEYRVQALSGPTTPLPDLQEEKSEGEMLTMVTSQSSEESGNVEASERTEGNSKEENMSNIEKKDCHKTNDQFDKDSHKTNDQCDKDSHKTNDQFDKDSHKTSPVNRREAAPGSPNAHMRNSSTRRASNVSVGFSERRFSQFASPGEGAAASNHDCILVNRSLDRRDSKTPAGDMWHVLNVNRRLEAAEATIQGMTSLVDNISSDVIDLKDAMKNIEELKEANRKSSSIVIQKPPKSNDNDAEMDVYNEQLARLSKVLQEHEESIKKSATKEDIKEMCSTSLVEAIIEEKLSSQPSSSKSVVSTGSNAGSNAALNADQPPKRRESRTKVLQEMINRVVKLEETQMILNEELDNVKAAVSLKSDKQDEDFIDKLRNEIELLAKEIEKLQAGENEVNVIKQRLDTIAEQSENVKISSEYNSKEQGTITKNVANVEKQLESLTDTVFTKLGSCAQQQSQADTEAVTKLRAQMNGLQEQQNLVESEIHQINKQLTKTNEKIISWDEVTENLKATKIDKDCLDKKLDVKANKSELRNKISQDQYDSGLGHLDRSLQDTLQRVEQQDSVLKQFLIKIDAKFEQKLDREDVNKLKEYIEKRLKTVKVKAPEPVPSEDAAAGFRKPLLRKFHCISCDRPLELLQDDAIPSLPVCQALPGSRAIRPYTTFELEQIRKHMRGDGSNKDRFELAHERERLQKQLLRLCGAHDLDDFAARTSRSCGGSHTLLDPQKRGMIKATMYRDEPLLDEQPIKPIIEGDVMGRDGHIYKGRLEHLPPIQQKEMSKAASQSDVPMLACPSFQQQKTEIENQPMATTSKA